ncbi:unnamed protein product [Anisakis simplex]|uniref:Phage tail protein I n=1 Tax=Anisakis simplex TaxID=6269 RepID=A0A0M3KEN2_ANISI|nr:unnamed protein product [Anisakis simplex]
MPTATSGSIEIQSVQKTVLSSIGYLKSIKSHITDTILAKRISAHRFEYANIVTPKLINGYLVYEVGLLREFIFVCGENATDPYAIAEWRSLKARIVTECSLTSSELLIDAISAIQSAIPITSCNATAIGLATDSEGRFAEWALPATNGYFSTYWIYSH